MTQPAPTWNAWAWASKAAWIMGTVLLVLLVIVPAVGWGLLHSEAVTRSLVPHIPGVRVFEPQGALLGDFRARRVEIDLPRGSLLSLDDASWSNLRVSLDTDAQWYVGLHAARLTARLVQIKWVPNPHPGPTTDPYDLRLPLSVTVDRLLVQRGDSVLWGESPLLNLDGRLELGQRAHRADVTRLEYGPWALKGKGQVETLGHLRGELNLTAAGTYRQGDQAWPVKAHVQASGLLTELTVRAQVQAGAAPQVQSLTGSAQLKLWAPWMLPALHIKASQFDLAALTPQLPRTALSGALDWDRQGADMLAKVDLRNAVSGDWMQGLLPVRQLAGQITLPQVTRADSVEGLTQAGEVHLQAQVLSQGEGQVQLQGTWDRRPAQTGPHATRWPNRLKLSMQGVNLRALDGRAPALTLSGDTAVSTDHVWRQADELMQAPWDVVAQLMGQYAGDTAPSKATAVQARLRGQWQAGRVQVDELSLISEGAQAQLKGQGRYAAPAQAGSPWTWQAKGQLQVQNFDPRVWLPWPQALNGANRLQGQVDVDLASNWLGQLAVRLDPSVLAGSNLQGRGRWTALPGKAQAQVDADLTFAGNHVAGQGQIPWRIGPDGLPRVKGEQRWELDVQAPALRSLQAVLAGWGVRELAGQVDAHARFAGQWPQFSTEGQLKAQQVRWQVEGLPASAIDNAKADWSLQTMNWDAPLQWQAQVTGMKLPHVLLEQGSWTLTGTGRAHQSVLRLQGRPTRADPQQPSADKPLEPMQIALSLSGGLLGQGSEIAGWRGHVQGLNWQSLADARRVWLQAQPFDVAWRRGTVEDQVSASPVELIVMGAPLTIKELDWQGGADSIGRVKAWLQLAPLNLAALLKQWQPQAGWGGDLMVDGEVRLQHSQAQPWQVQANVSKRSGDLSLSELNIEGNSLQKLGIDVASVQLTARDGTWLLTEQFEGSVLGRLSGRQTVKAARPQDLPAASDPLAGELDIQIGSLRPWAAWVPAGWRLSGQLKGRAELSGTLGAPQYRGTLNGQNLRLAHALLGVNLTDGQLALDLQGDHARLTELLAKGGAQGGVIRATGEASLGASPQASLDVQAEHFALFQRIDRRLVVSGQARAVLTEADIQLNGKVRVDEGMFDFSRSDAPTVGEDVNVINGPGQTPQAEEAANTASSKRKMVAAVDLDLGDRLHLRGRGLDTDLTGTLKFTTPNNRPALQGTVKAVKGTYAAYGQKLDIERGAIVFTGPIENPRLDILAMRRQSPMAASSDVKVGVQIAGTAQDPRISLYSDPSMSETDKLSWLVLGRGPSGLGGADIGLLQSAAVALLSGEGPSTTDNIMTTLGLDELSLHQSDGTVRETVVNVGKQLSKYWYLGYERNLNATSGNWQLIYRLAQRFTLRAQTGVDNAVDLIWSWRWD
ncbi:MAG: translocation/assembly module TamB domain-containing protein [Acidobacteriota bacterium]